MNLNYEIIRNSVRSQYEASQRHQLSVVDVAALLISSSLQTTRRDLLSTSRDKNDHRSLPLISSHMSTGVPVWFDPCECIPIPLFYEVRYPSRQCLCEMRENRRDKQFDRHRWTSHCRRLRMHGPKLVEVRVRVRYKIYWGKTRSCQLRHRFFAEIFRRVFS